MKKLKFAKMHGAANDFVVADNREGQVPEPLSAFAAKVCDRRRSVGGDGILLVEKSSRKAFRMRYFNADGSEADMCGNGARCIVKFAQKIGAAAENTDFENPAGDFKAESLKDGRVLIHMSQPHSAKLGLEVEALGGKYLGHFINTGVPHFVVPVEGLEKFEVDAVGRALRFHEAFKPKGTNVNFVEQGKPGELHIRTYERGVEGETLACGTGITAAAVLLGMAKGEPSPLKVRTQGGDLLEIGFRLEGGEAREVTMTGPVVLAFEGELDLDQLMGR